MVEKTTEIIRKKLQTENYKIVSKKIIKLYECIDDVKNVVEILFDDEIIVTTFTVVGENIEQYYIDLLGGK